MAEETNAGGGDPTPDIKNQNADQGADDDAQKVEHLSGLSSQDLDEVEE